MQNFRLVGNVSFFSVHNHTSMIGMVCVVLALLTAILPPGAPLARRSGPRAVSGVLSVDVAGAVGDIDKPKSTSPLLYSTASVGEIHGRSVGSDASTPEVRIGGPQNASTDEGGEGLDGSGPGQGSLMMGPEMERQSVGEDLPIDVEDLYGAYY